MRFAHDAQAFHAAGFAQPEKQSCGADYRPLGLAEYYPELLVLLHQVLVRDYAENSRGRMHPSCAIASERDDELHSFLLRVIEHLASYLVLRLRGHRLNIAHKYEEVVFLSLHVEQSVLYHPHDPVLLHYHLVREMRGDNVSHLCCPKLCDHVVCRDLPNQANARQPLYQYGIFHLDFFLFEYGRFEQVNHFSRLLACTWHTCPRANTWEDAGLRWAFRSAPHEACTRRRICTSSSFSCFSPLLFGRD